EVAVRKAMVDEFSAFARLPAAHLENADLNEVIRQAVALYEDRLEGPEVCLDLDPNAPSVMLDVEQIKRVFVNLIDNALNALGNRERKIIRITPRHDLGEVCYGRKLKIRGTGSRRRIS